VLPIVTDMFGTADNVQLDDPALGDAYAFRVASLRELTDAYNRHVVLLQRQIRDRLCGDQGCRAIQQTKGIGPTTAAILVAEIGDISRFRSAVTLCSWARPDPRTSGIRHHRVARSHTPCRS
jgi:transposase